MAHNTFRNIFPEFSISQPYLLLLLLLRCDAIHVRSSSYVWCVFVCGSVCSYHISLHICHSLVRCHIQNIRIKRRNMLNRHIDVWYARIFFDCFNFEWQHTLLCEVMIQIFDSFGIFDNITNPKPKHVFEHSLSRLWCFDWNSSLMLSFIDFHWKCVYFS